MNDVAELTKAMYIVNGSLQKILVELVTLHNDLLRMNGVSGFNEECSKKL